MSKYFIFIAFWLLSAVIFLFACSKKTQQEEEILVENTSNKIDVKFIEELTIGGDTEDINYIFGDIDDIAIDFDLNIYILDGSSLNIRKYDKNGNHLTTFSGEGKGPGELIRPRKMAINSEGDIYVTDDALRRVTIFDKTGYMKKTQNLKYRPFHIVINNKDKIFVQKWPLVYKGGSLINKYDEDFHYLKSFCKPWDDVEIGALVVRSGWQGVLLANPNGNLLYCCNYPYKILQYDFQENLIRIVNRKLPSLKKPYPVENAPVPGVFRLEVPVMDIINLNRNILMVIIRNDSSNNPSFLFEFYSDKNELLASIPSENILKHTWIRVVKTDYLGNIYFDYQEPYPHIVKYKVEITYK